MKRLGYFLPQDRGVNYAPGVVPSVEENERQLNETKFYAFFKRNQVERKIYGKYLKMIAAKQSPQKIADKINKKLKYEMLYVEDNKLKQFFDYELQETEKAKKERMQKNVPDPTLPWSFELTYIQFAKRYVFKNKKKKFQRYQRLKNPSARLHLGYPGNDRFYLRILLTKRKGMTSIEELYDGPDGQKYPSFKLACLAWKYIDDSTEYYTVMVTPSPI